MEAWVEKCKTSGCSMVVWDGRRVVVVRRGGKEEEDRICIGRHEGHEVR
jgi:hypothetical protein